MDLELVPPGTAFFLGWEIEVKASPGADDKDGEAAPDNLPGTSPAVGSSPAYHGWLVHRIVLGCCCVHFGDVVWPDASLWWR